MTLLIKFIKFKLKKLIFYFGQILLMSILIEINHKYLKY